MEIELPHQSIEQADDDDSSSKIPTRCIGPAVLDALVAGSGRHKAFVLVPFGVVLGDAVHAAQRLGIEFAVEALSGTMLAGVGHSLVSDVLALLGIILRVVLGNTL